MATDPTTIWHREHEVVIAIINDVDAGVLCAGRLGTLGAPEGPCGKPLVLARCAWDRRISLGPHYDGTPWKLGEDAFEVLRHADGTAPDWTETECLAQARCPMCRQYSTLTTTQQAYGDLTTCTTPECTYRQWYDIGD